MFPTSPARPTWSAPRLCAGSAPGPGPSPRPRPEGLGPRPGKLGTSGSWPARRGSACGVPTRVGFGLPLSAWLHLRPPRRSGPGPFPAPAHPGPLLGHAGREALRGAGGAYIHPRRRARVGRARRDSTAPKGARRDVYPRHRIAGAGAVGTSTRLRALPSGGSTPRGARPPCSSGLPAPRSPPRPGPRGEERRTARDPSPRGRPRRAQPAQPCRGWSKGCRPGPGARVSRKQGGRAGQTRPTSAGAGRAASATALDPSGRSHLLGRAAEVGDPSREVLPSGDWAPRGGGGTRLGWSVVRFRTAGRGGRRASTGGC